MKTSDLTLSGIIVFMYVLLYLFNLLVVGIQRIKENWPVYRCQPLIMPFASIFGHDSSENFRYCIANMQKNFMAPLLQPLNMNVGMLGDITGGLTDSLNVNRTFMGNFRVSVNDTFMNIFGIVFNITTEIQRTTINIKDMLAKLVGIVTTGTYVINGGMMGLQSFWSGPPGDLVRAMCFHPDTKLKLQSGEMVSMKDLKLNSTLQNGPQVCAIMQISNLDKNGAIVEKMYKVKRTMSNNKKMAGDACAGDACAGDACVDDDDILVSGSHLIYDPNTKQFVHVKDLPSSELTEINCEVLSCLITSDHTIPIGDWIFHDWEDSNGSAPKKIGGLK
jgi:hypothetical protein